MPTLTIRKKRIVKVAAHKAGKHKTGKRVLMYTSAVFGLALAFFLVKVAALPLIAQGTTVPVQPIVPLAAPGFATSNFIAGLDIQGLGAQKKIFGYVTHRYLTGRGTLVGFAGDNIQIFEYADGEAARAEASAIFKRAPRLATESFFHLYLKNNLIGLYFGHNATVTQAAQRAMGDPL